MNQFFFIGFLLTKWRVFLMSKTMYWNFCTICTCSWFIHNNNAYRDWLILRIVPHFKTKWIKIKCITIHLQNCRVCWNHTRAQVSLKFIFSPLPINLGKWVTTVFAIFLFIILSLLRFPGFFWAMVWQIDLKLPVQLHNDAL